MRRTWRRRSERLELLDLVLEVDEDGIVRLDHLCAGAASHRLLGVDLTDAERSLLAVGEEVRVVAACDRCIWQRRLVLRRRDG